MCCKYFKTICHTSERKYALKEQRLKRNVTLIYVLSFMQLRKVASQRACVQLNGLADNGFVKRHAFDEEKRNIRPEK